MYWTLRDTTPTLDRELQSSQRERIHIVPKSHAHESGSGPRLAVSKRHAQDGTNLGPEPLRRRPSSLRPLLLLACRRRWLGGGRHWRCVWCVWQSVCSMRLRRCGRLPLRTLPLPLPLPLPRRHQRRCRRSLHLCGGRHPRPAPASVQGDGGEQHRHRHGKVGGPEVARVVVVVERVPCIAHPAVVVLPAGLEGRRQTSCSMLV